MSDSNLIRYEHISNILRDDWEEVIKKISDTPLEDLIDEKKLHREKTETIKKNTSHFFSESEQAQILNYKTKIGKKIYYDAFQEKGNKVEKEVSRLKRKRDALNKEKVNLKIEISRLESVCLNEKIVVDMA